MTRGNKGRTWRAGALLLAGLLLLLALNAAAEPPLAPAPEDGPTASALGPSATLFSYQGQLFDAGGSPLDGSVPMAFRLYHQATDGAAFWTEVYSDTQAIPVSDGLFHVLLGSLAPLNPADLTGDVYLELEVNGETLSPRELFSSVAYAVEAGTLPAGATTRGSLTVGGDLSLAGTDLILGNVAGRGDGGRALVHDVNDTLTLNFAQDFGGGIKLNGPVSCGALVEAHLQTAEELAAGRIDRFAQGDVLCWGIDRLELCAAANDRLVQAVADEQGRPIVLGAEAIKVLGPVRRGDLLVASDVPGYARVDDDPQPGSVIAQALEDFAGERGLIKAMIRKF